MAEGRRGGHGCLRYCCRIVPRQAAPADGEASPRVRVLVSVPKKHFKRAVKRNLLKRRIREAWRLTPHSGPDTESYDILFTYVADDVRSFEEIRAAMTAILSEIRKQ